LAPRMVMINLILKPAPVVGLWGLVKVQAF